MDYTTNQQMRDASPDSIFQAQKKPSTKAIESLKEWRDSEADSEFDQELLDAVILKLKHEVKQ